MKKYIPILCAIFATNSTLADKDIKSVDQLSNTSIKKLQKQYPGSISIDNSNEEPTKLSLATDFNAIVFNIRGL